MLNTNLFISIIHKVFFQPVTLYFGIVFSTVLSHLTYKVQMSSTFNSFSIIINAVQFISYEEKSHFFYLILYHMKLFNYI